MTTLDERFALEDALKAVQGSRVWDIPTSGQIIDYQCPLCDTPLVKDLTFGEMDKIKTWTVAQLVAWHHLQSQLEVHQNRRFPGHAGGW